MTLPFVIGLDGALGAFSVSIRDAERCVTRVSSGQDALERGLPLLVEALAEYGAELRSAAAIACGIGPGGFTGLRIVLASAKALAFAARVPLIGISSFDLVAARATEGTPDAVIVRPRGNVFCARIGRGHDRCEMTGRLDLLAERMRALPASAAVAVEPPEAVAELHAIGLIVTLLETRAETGAETASRIALDRLRAGRLESGSPHAVRAEYGEAPATTAPVVYAS